MPPVLPADKPESPAPAARPQPPVKSSSIEVGFLKDVFAEITGTRAAVPGRDDAANDRSGR